MYLTINTFIIPLWAKFNKRDTMGRATGCSIVVVCTIRVRVAAVRFRPARPEGGVEKDSLLSFGGIEGSQYIVFACEYDSRPRPRVLSEIQALAQYFG